MTADVLVLGLVHPGMAHLTRRSSEGEREKRAIFVPLFLSLCLPLLNQGGAIRRHSENYDNSSLPKRIRRKCRKNKCIRRCRRRCRLRDDALPKFIGNHERFLLKTSIRSAKSAKNLTVSYCNYCTLLFHFSCSERNVIVSYVIIIS